MPRKYLLWFVVIVFGVIVIYGAYSYYSISNNTESVTVNTTNYNDTNIPLLNETDNKTNRSTVSIPLEKPPFIE